MAAPKREVERNREILNMRARGRTNAEIAEHYGLSTVRIATIVKREIQIHTDEATVEAVRQVELSKLDELEREAWRILEAAHYAYTQKGLIDHPDGGYLRDSSPVLAAMDRILKIQERRARMLGFDAPTRIQITGDLIEQEIRRLEKALAENDPDPVDVDVE